MISLKAYNIIAQQAQDQLAVLQEVFFLIYIEIAIFVYMSPMICIGKATFVYTSLMTCIENLDSLYIQESLYEHHSQIFTPRNRPRDQSNS